MLALWRGNAELAAESEAAFAAYEGGDVIDVGAFHGWYAVLLSPKAPPGTTFVLLEPDPSAFPTLLQVTASLSRTFPHLRYVPVPRAAGDGTPVHAVYPDGPDGHPRFEPSPAPDAEAGVRTDALVDVLDLTPGFVKVDVEGAERYVLRGLGGVLEAHRPTMLVEVHPAWQPAGFSAEDAVQPLQDASYRSENLAVTPIAHRQLWKPAG